MILALESVSYAGHYAALREFVLHKEATFQPNFRVLAFLVPDLPQAGTITRFHGRVDTFAPGFRFTGDEISWFPFGFLYAAEIGRGYEPEYLTDVTRWFTTGNRRERHRDAVTLFCRVTGVDSIQCGLGNNRMRPQIDYIDPA
jgi:hypothetical protein